jgi:hypothetical protein
MVTQLPGLNIPDPRRQDVVVLQDSTVSNDCLATVSLLVLYLVDIATVLQLLWQRPNPPHQSRTPGLSPLRLSCL